MSPPPNEANARVTYIAESRLTSAAAGQRDIFIRRKGAARMPMGWSSFVFPPQVTADRGVDIFAPPGLGPTTVPKYEVSSDHRFVALPS